MPLLAPELAGAVFDDNDVALVDLTGQNQGYFELRRRNASSFVYGPAEPLPVSARIVLGPMPIAGLTELFAFLPRYQLPVDKAGNALGGSVGFQLSFDGGVTWLYWNGSIWTTATTEYNTETEVDLHFPALDLSLLGRSLMVAILLSADASLSFSPRFLGLDIACEIAQRLDEDIRRSVHKYLTDALAQSVCFFEDTLDAASNKVTVDVDSEILAIVAVYNLTADPGRTKNLFLSRSGTVVTLTASQAKNSDIEVVYKTGCEVYGAVAEDTLYTTKVPSVSFVIPKRIHDDRWNNGTELAVSKARDLARERPAPDLDLCTMRIYCMANRDAEAMAFAQALDRALRTKHMRYLPTGEPMRMQTLAPFTTDDLGSRGLLCKRLDLAFAVRVWRAEYAETNLVKRIILKMETNGYEVDQKVIDVSGGYP